MCFGCRHKKSAIFVFKNQEPAKKIFKALKKNFLRMCIFEFKIISKNILALALSHEQRITDIQQKNRTRVLKTHPANPSNNKTENENGVTRKFQYTHLGNQ